MTDQEENVGESGKNDVKISRRTMLASLGAAGVALAAGMNFDVKTAFAAAGGTIGVYNVQDYSGTDTAAIQAAINDCNTDGGGIVFFPVKTYLITSTITLYSNVVLLGAGIASKIKADSTLPAGSGLFLNSTITGTVDTYYDRHIRISQLAFEGNNSSARTTALISFVKAAHIVIDNCAFQNNSHMGIAFGGCFDLQVQNCSFTNLGRPKPSTVSAPALWTEKSGDGSHSKNITVDNCHFKDNNWSGCYFMPKGGQISNCTFINNGESTIFTNPSGSELVFSDNYISGTIKSNISATGIECGSSNVLIHGNHIKDCQDNGISLMDVQNVIISNNLISSNGRDTVSFPTAAGISVITYQTSPNLQPDNIKIVNNRIMDKQSVKTQSYGIGVGGIGLPVTRIDITDNNLTDYKTAAIDIDGAKWGAGSFVANNIGHASGNPKIGQFLCPGSTGAFAVTGIGFRPRRLAFRATLPGAQVYESDAEFVLDQGICNWRAIQGGAATGSTVSNKAVTLYDSAGTTLLCQAGLSSRDPDGFTLSFTTATATPYVTWIAYP